MVGGISHYLLAIRTIRSRIFRFNLCVCDTDLQFVVEEADPQQVQGRS